MGREIRGATSKWREDEGKGMVGERERKGGVGWRPLCEILNTPLSFCH